jgi:hypothetical protein
MTKSEREAIQKLHVECTSALDKYLKEGHEMCRILSAIESHPVSQKQREAIVRQRVRENEAQRAYDSARQALFALAGWV